MSNSIMVLGNSGQGKSTSYLPNAEIGIEGLDPKETFLINVRNKPLPARGWKNMYKVHHPKDNPDGNMICTDNYDTIKAYLVNIPKKMPHIKNIIIDDSNYLMSGEFMQKSNEGGFQKYTNMAKNFYEIIHLGTNLPDDMNFIMLAHTEIVDGSFTIKTVGRLLGEKIVLEGLVTYTLFTTINVGYGGKTEYGFLTNTTRNENNVIVPAKTPPGCFKELTVKNDLGYIVKEIEKYNKGE